MSLGISLNDIFECVDMCSECMDEIDISMEEIDMVIMELMMVYMISRLNHDCAFVSLSILI